MSSQLAYSDNGFIDSFESLPSEGVRFSDVRASKSSSVENAASNGAVMSFVRRAGPEEIAGKSEGAKNLRIAAVRCSSADQRLDARRYLDQPIYQITARKSIGSS